MDMLEWLRKHRDTEGSAQRSVELSTPNAAGISRSILARLVAPRSRR
jgi:hypothetical protein